MSRLNVDTGYDKIHYCSVCGTEHISKESLDNGTIVIVTCYECDAELMISLYDDETNDEY